MAANPAVSYAHGKASLDRHAGFQRLPLTRMLLDQHMR